MVTMVALAGSRPVGSSRWLATAARTCRARARGRRDLQRLDRQELVEASRMELKAATAAAAPRAGLRVRGAGGV